MSHLLNTKLAAVRRKHAGVVAISAIAAVVGLFILALAGGMLLDWWFELNVAARASLLAIDLAGVIALLVLYALLPVVRGPDAEAAALWVERAEPVFRNRLISVVQLGGADAVTAAGSSPAMVRELVRDTEAIAGPMDFTRVVRTARMKRLMIAAVVLAIAFAGSIAYAGRSGWALLQRAMLVSGVEVPRRTQIECLTGNVTIARGDAVTIVSIVRGRVPSSGTIRTSLANRSTAQFPLEANAKERGRFTRTIENVQEGFSYQLWLGDNHTASFAVEVALRPMVTSVECTQVYPPYTRLAPRQRPAADLSLLAGSRLGIAVRASKPLAKIGNRVHFYGSDVDFPLEVDARDPTKLKSRDGEQPSLAIPAKTTAFSIELVDTLGLHSKDPVAYPIHVMPDRSPVVRVTFPEAKETTVTPVARPSIGIEAADDFAVGRVALRYRVTKSAPDAAATAADAAAAAIPMEMNGETPKLLRRRFVWELGKQTPAAAVGDVIEFWLEAADTNDITGPGTASSEHFQFRVITEADKRAELMNRLGDYLGQINEVSEKQRDLNAKLGTIISAEQR